MTLPSTGIITLSQVNTELGRSTTATINMNDAAVRTLAGVGGSGTTIAMQNLRGKSASVTLQFNNSDSFFSFAGGQQYAKASISLLTNGSIVVATTEAGQTTAGPTAYLNPLTTNAGANFEYRLNVSTLPADFYARLDAPLQSLTATGYTGYLDLNVNREILVEAAYYDFPPGADGFYGTLEIRNKTTLQTISRFFDLEIELY
jgi:hypothetical protein